MIAWRTAMEQVFILQNNPDAIYDMRTAPLPEGISTLMRLASNPGDLLNDVSQTLAIEAEVLQSHISDYLVAMCFFPNAQPARILGLNNAKNIPLAKEHHRLLLKWLHPDKNPEHKLYAEQVNRAWAWLKSQEAQTNKEDDLKSKSVEAMKVPIRTTHDIPLRKSRFPLFLGVLTVLAVALLAVSYWPDGSVYVSGENNAEAGKQERDVNSETEKFNQSISKRYKQPTIMPLPPPPNVPEASDSVTSELASAPVEKPFKNTTTTDLVANTKQVLPNHSLPKTVEQNMSAEATVEPEIQSVKADKPVKTEPSIKQAEQVLNAFASSYQIGDLEQFMALFSANARNNRGNRSAIEQDYRNLFNESEQRSIQFSNMQWQEQNNVTLSASYDTRVKWQDKFRASKQTGKIEFTFIEENGRVRIQQVLLKK